MGGRLLSHAVARALALGHVYQERDHGSPRLIKREEAARASLHMASPQQGQLPLPAIPTPTRMAGSKETKKAQSLSHQIAGCSRGGSPRSLPSAGRVTKTSKQKGTKKGPKASNKTKQST